jgi:hypothetical protein
MKVLAVFFVGGISAAEVIDLVVEAGVNLIEKILSVVLHYVL